MKTVGFNLPWDKDEITENTPHSVEPMTLINNEGRQPDSEIKISPAHAEVKARVLATELIITGKKFASLSKEKKLEFIKELEFLTALDTELTNKI